MRRIKFKDDYESITANKEYEILPKSYTDGVYDFIYFVDDVGEIMEVKQMYGAPPSTFFEVILDEE